MRIRVTGGIRFKLGALILLLVSLVTAASSVIVVGIMDRFVLRELLQKGFSMAGNAATAAGYSLLSGDTLALDNLTGKLREAQGDLLFVAVVDNEGVIRAHSDVGKSGYRFFDVSGETLLAKDDGGEARRTFREGAPAYEFKVPILFAGKKLGAIDLAIKADAVLAAQADARRKILFVSVAVLLLGALGTLLISAVITTPVKKLSVGVSELTGGNYHEIPVVSRDELGELTANFNEMARVITSQKGKLEDGARELEEAYISTVRLLATVIDARDDYTLGHSTRVARWSLLVGEKLGLTEEELRDLEITCMFHDVGKIKTPDHILNKEGPLTPDEHLTMMRHTVDGATILMVVESLHKYIPAVLHHHEWYNGSGYPEGRGGDEIPLFAAIISVADAFDAMTSSRPYRTAMPREHAIGELMKFAGTQYNPRILEVFAQVLREQSGGRVKTFLNRP
ncbi:MAG: HD domain-containing protein [Nitrospirota bacterium]